MKKVLEAVWKFCGDVGGRGDGTPDWKRRSPVR